jgi:DNA-binding IclR family transcriptional regulator
MHAVSSGQVFLANMSEPAIERYLALPRVAFTDRTLTDSTALRERLRGVLLAGYAWVHDEFAEGLSSVAAPIVDALGNVNAAVHVHGPSYRFPGAGTEERVAEAVMAAAAQISARARE